MQHKQIAAGEKCNRPALAELPDSNEIGRLNEILVKFALLKVCWTNRVPKSAPAELTGGGFSVCVAAEA